jgi:hypothetical protein|tara:strand:+ start:9630 stop:9932 length:303 start_codon:yes stop_codon:yes gene_type:complete
MKKLWFNQSGDEEGEPELPLGDTIDKFTPSGEFVYSHEFDERGVPSSIKVVIDSTHCSFLNDEINNLYSRLNFANDQEEIERIYSSIDILAEVKGKNNCN